MRGLWQAVGMKLELPDTPTSEQFTPEELRLELACALYARHKLGTIAAAEFAGVDFFAFQMALRERRVPKHYDVEDLRRDVETLNQLFPDSPIPLPSH
jgi:predicted HTH domain antitoxin